MKTKLKESEECKLVRDRSVVAAGYVVAFAKRFTGARYIDLSILAFMQLCLVKVGQFPLFLAI